MLACGIQNPGLWNPEYSSRNPESTNGWNPESTFHWQRLKSSSWNPESTAWKKRQVILSFDVLVILFNFLLHSWWHHDLRKQGEDLLNDDLCHVSEDSVKVLMDLLAWENSRHLATLPLVSPPNDVWETSAEISYWWRVTTEIWVVTRHQYGISVLVSQTSFGGKPAVASPNVSCFLRLLSVLPPGFLLYQCAVSGPALVWVTLPNSNKTVFHRQFPRASRQSHALTPSSNRFNAR